jgi:hypothetical protein
MSTTSRLTFVAALIAILAVAPALSAQAAHHKRVQAQSYSFPTYSFLHRGKNGPYNTVPGSAAAGDSH